MENFLLIALNGLPSGKTVFEGRLSKEFFVEFGNSEILDADVRTVVTADKSGSYVGIDMTLEGNVTVECDRCLEDLVLPVRRTVLLEVKFGDGQAQEQQEGEREVLCLSRDNAELDLSQTAYDYVCLSLPLQRHHGEGGCNPEALKHLCGFGGGSESGPVPGASREAGSDSPFAALRGMFSEEDMR